MENRGGRVAGKNRIHGGTITDICLLEGISRIVSDWIKRSEVCGIRELVNVDDGYTVFPHELPAYSGADETCSSRNQNTHADILLKIGR
jgi:hypothetical protein